MTFLVVVNELVVAGRLRVVLVAAVDGLEFWAVEDCTTAAAGAGEKKAAAKAGLLQACSQALSSKRLKLASMISLKSSINLQAPTSYSATDVLDLAAEAIQLLDQFSATCWPTVSSSCTFSLRGCTCQTLLCLLLHHHHSPGS